MFLCSVPVDTEGLFLFLNPLLGRRGIVNFKALGCDIKAVREIPFFAILEFELLGLEEKYKDIDNSDTKN